MRLTASDGGGGSGGAAVGAGAGGGASGVSEPIDAAGLVKEGYLYKKSSSKAVSAKLPTGTSSWKRLWFRLEDGVLYYQKRTKGAGDDGVRAINLLICTVNVSAKETGKRFCFDLVSPYKSYTLQAESAASLTSWVDALRASIEHALLRARPERQPRRSLPYPASDGQRRVDEFSGGATGRRRAQRGAARRDRRDARQPPLRRLRRGGHAARLGGDALRLPGVHRVLGHPPLARCAHLQGALSLARHVDARDGARRRRPRQRGRQLRPTLAAPLAVEASDGAGGAEGAAAAAAPSAPSASSSRAEKEEWIRHKYLLKSGIRHDVAPADLPSALCDAARRDDAVALLALLLQVDTVSGALDALSRARASCRCKPRRRRTRRARWSSSSSRARASRRAAPQGAPRRTSRRRTARSAASPS